MITRIISLTQGMTALVDDADYHLVSPYCWTAFKSRTSVNTWYAQRTICHPVGRRSNVLMHRVILAAPAGVMVDHKSHDGLDNRRDNIRLATRGQNAANSHRSNASGYRGVLAHGNYWIARIWHEGRKRHLGTFKTPEDAAHAYNLAAKELHGDFATLNSEVQS